MPLTIGGPPAWTFDLDPDRYARSWLARLGTTTHSDITSALVAVAGAFIGFHIGVILGLLPSPLMFYLAAIAGAAIVLWFCGEGDTG